MADTTEGLSHFQCQGCAAKLEYAPGTKELVCRYCGTKQSIPEAPEAAAGQSAEAPAIREQDYASAISQVESEAVTEEKLVAACPTCGAETTLGANVVSTLCPYCGSQISGAKASKRQIKPQAVLPFQIKKDEAQKRFKSWVGGLWFAPSALKSQAKAEALQGVYTPYWTYDSEVTTPYQGQRGDYYYITETYTEVENGQTVTKERTVRHTRWSYASGIVHNSFDDVLILASGSLPKKQAVELEPWNLDALLPYREEYLAGFKTECYALGLKEGFATAVPIMMETVNHSIRRDIGGDEQLISNAAPEFNDITFKHILLPVWLTAFRFQNKVFQVLVNAQTGEVQGERPYSWIKITMAVLAGIALVGGIALALSGK